MLEADVRRYEPGQGSPERAQCEKLGTWAHFFNERFFIFDGKMTVQKGCAEARVRIGPKETSKPQRLIAQWDVDGLRSRERVHRPVPSHISLPAALWRNVAA